MKRNYLAYHALLAIVLIMITSACSKEGEKDEQFDKVLVVNEIMASNQTGLLTEEGELCDWIEIKNISENPVSLKGYALACEKKKKDETDADSAKQSPKQKKDKKKSKKNKKDKAATDYVATEMRKWEFPDVTINPGQFIVVFASKGGESNGDELHADFGLSSKKGLLQILSPSGSIMTEVKYGEQDPDMSYCRTASGKYEKTYLQSPGFENTKGGYEKYIQRLDAMRKSPVLIWEVMARAEKTSKNWVEFKNVSEKTVSLKEYGLTSKFDKGVKWNFPDIELEPGKTFVVQTLGKKADSARVSEAAFKLGKNETVVLTRNGKFADGVCAKTTSEGTSIGRAPGRKGLFYFANPTRGQENESPHRFITPMPAFDKAAGIYKEKKLTLHLADATHTVHYTLDGSEPTAASPVLKDSIAISKTTVVRTFAEGDSASLRSPVSTRTYVLGTEHDLAVMSVSINPGYLFNPATGMYMPGPGYDSEWPHMGANYWKPIERKAHVEFIDGKEGFSADCGLRIFGGFSRAEAKKSFSVRFRNNYGCNELSYDIYEQGEKGDYRNFVLRSGSQDYMRCMIRDEFFTSLMAPSCPTMLIQAYRPVALYVNGEYFGLYYIREKIDKHFVARHLGVSDDNITILMSIGYQEEGTNDKFNALKSYVRSHDMSQKECYDYVCSQADIDGLIDQKLGQIYSANVDVGNVRYVRSDDESSDKKWYFVYYDLDCSWVGQNPPSFWFSSSEPGVGVHNLFIERLLRNPDFRARFLERLSTHLHTTFSTKNTTQVFDNLVTTIKPEMKRNCERWPQLTYKTWEKNIADFRARFETQNKTVLNDLRTYLHITEQENKKYFGDLGY